ncbi:MAG TPA: FlgD immunoglobulin-like domain containing protein, partial [Candidatus Wallbacteria bacterium]|nr:FlgD immunoglobulin-like domain containing protein [Candidatus Wallbacteria bacterium]
RNIVNSPNPFNYITNPPGTYFNYSLDTEQAIGEVVIKIYSMSGRLIRTLDMSSNMKGLNQQYWDGLDESGNRLANGVYLYKIHAAVGSDEFVARGKLIVMSERNLN